MIRRLLIAAVCVLAIVWPVPASAGAGSHTWHSCQHSYGAYSTSALTSAQTYKYCYVIGVRVVSRSPAGSTVTQAWNTSTSSAKRNLYAYAISGNYVLRSHHFVQDVFGTREYHTCWPGQPACVGGIV